MAKFTGKGAQILIKTTGATPAWVAFGQVQEIGDISVTADEVDVTTLDAGDYRDYIQGFKDPGECQLTIIFDPNMTDQGTDPDGWLGLFASGATRDFAIRWNSGDVSGEAFGTFTGFVRDMDYGALNADDPQTIQPTIRVTSPIELVDTLPATLTGAEVSPEEVKLAAQRAALAKAEAELKRRQTQRTPAAETELMPAAA
jgi:hypothetical protein